MKKIIALILVLAATVCVLTACGASLKGDWSNTVAGIEMYGFKFTDSTVEMRTAGAVVGTYDYTDNGDGTLTVKQSGVDAKWTYEIKDGKLNINISDYGSTIICTKK